MADEKTSAQTARTSVDGTETGFAYISNTDYKILYSDARDYFSGHMAVPADSGTPTLADGESCLRTVGTSSVKLYVKIGSTTYEGTVCTLTAV